MKVHSLIFVIIGILSSCGEKKNPAEETNVYAQKENFHIYLLMGQSNMAGRGKVESIDTLTHPRVFMLDNDMKWVLARDPIHFDKSFASAGLGLTFGKVMANENNDIRIGLIPCAKGGSSINQWFQDSLHQQTNSYPYNEMIKKAKKGMSKGILKGILWHQGESDTGTETGSSTYSGKFNAMLGSIKADLEIATIPVVMGEIGYFFYEKQPLAKELNLIIKRIVDSNNCIELVSGELLNHKGDTIHFNSDSYHELGIRYASKMIKVQSLCSTANKR
jgi:hypothetical protein